MNNSFWRRDLPTITSVYSSPPNPDTSIEVKCEEKSAYVDLTNPETPFVSKCTGKAARRSLPYTAQERWAKLLPPRRADVCLSFSLSHSFSLFLFLSHELHVISIVWRACEQPSLLCTQRTSTPSAHYVKRRVSPAFLALRLVDGSDPIPRCRSAHTLVILTTETDKCKIIFEPAIVPVTQSNSFRTNIKINNIF